MSKQRKVARAFLRASLKVGGRRLRGARRQPKCDFKMESLIELMRQRIQVAVDLGPTESRSQEMATPVPPQIREQLIYKTEELGGVTVERITPRGEPAKTSWLYFHGGGYTVCSPATHRGLTSALALASGGEVVAVDYRLAPEHPHPAALEDALAVYRALLGEYDAKRVVFGGDSAGGGLALATLVALRDAGDPLPAAAALLSPWVDLSCQSETIDQYEPSDYLTRRILEVYAEAYVADQSVSLAAISPIHADLTGLPPLMIQVGGAETLLGDSLTLDERARDAGVEVDLEVEEGAFHVFQVFAAVVPGGKAAIRRLGDFAQRHWAPTT